jgi:hypothetical protein
MSASLVGSDRCIRYRISALFHRNSPCLGRRCTRIDREWKPLETSIRPVEIASCAIVERQKLRCYNWIMQKDPRSLAGLSDEELLVKVKVLAGREREATAQLIASLAELDVRRLYLGEGFPSLFTYCTQALHLSEHAAYNRIEAARAARKWPAIVQMIADGRVTISRRPRTRASARSNTWLRRCVHNRWCHRSSGSSRRPRPR